MGGHLTIMRNGVSVHKCRRKWGRGSCAAEDHKKMGTPSGCFLHLPLVVFHLITHLYILLNYKYNKFPSISLNNEPMTAKSDQAICM